jgi:hypothetical protein
MPSIKSRIVAHRFILIASLTMLIAIGTFAVMNSLNTHQAKAATVSTCTTTGTVTANGGAYIVQNNLWNTAATGQQCISVNDATGAFSVTTANNSVSTSGAPASYPSVFKGCHWGQCTTNSNLPIQVGSIASLNSSWNVSLSTGNYDVAYDIWINQSSTTTGQPNGTEIMVWINHAGPPQPFGSQVATASINGSNWNVWTGNQSGWKIISYVAQTPTTSVNFDLNNFIKDSVARGSSSNSWYLIDVEAGTEIWSNGVGFASNSFSVSPVAVGNATPTPPSTPTPRVTPPPVTPTPRVTPPPVTPTPSVPTPTPGTGTNGVTVTGSVASSSPWFSEEDVKFNNTSTITAMTVTITVQKTTGVSYNGMYTTFGGMTSTHADNGSTITYTFTLGSGQTISAGSNRLAAAQFGGNGTAHSTSGDTYTVTSTSNGVVSTVSGHF